MMAPDTRRAGHRHAPGANRLAAVALVALLAVSAAACGGGGDARSGKGLETPSTTVVSSPQLPSYVSFAARARVPLLNIYDEPGASTPSRELENPWIVHPDFPDQTVPQVFLVKEQRPDGWVKVLLPVRPNGTTGWVRLNDVEITQNSYRVRVELGAHKITVTQAETVVYEGVVAVGKPDTPTPAGEYFVRVTVKAIDPNTIYGPYAWGLSSHSNVFETFNGGDGEIGIHGNNDASVLGTDASAGCVRMDNDAITMLVRRVPLGTPVDIVA